MSLSSEIYQVLEDIVGEKNISAEPAILDSYTFQFGAEEWTLDQSKFLPRAEAVLLPGSTEEVQAIVKACNRYRVKYKAFSTGWGYWGLALTEDPINQEVKNTIQIDLRRMDRILEIDRKNMYAVIEPFVVAGVLQREAMKVGLTCNMCGPGGVGSPLAQSCSGMPGHSAGSIYTGHGSEVLLAEEWVLPTGEIVRTGSLGSGAGWFCGEGPGPSLRGISRGKVGGMGGIGIFTRCAVKLSPWPGPPELPIEGQLPAYNTPVPDNFRIYTIAFRDWQSYANAQYKLWDYEIGFLAHRHFNQMGDDLSPAMFKAILPYPDKTLNDLEEAVKTPEIQKLTEEMRISFQLILAGQTPGDIEYQEKVLDQILKETGGWIVKAMLDEPARRYQFLFLTIHHNKNVYYSFCGEGGVSFTQFSTPDTIIKQIPIMREVMRKHQETGKLVKCGADTLMGTLAGMGGGGYSVLEMNIFPDVLDGESVKEDLAAVLDEGKTLREKGFFPASSYFGHPLRTRTEQDAFYSKTPEVFHWQRKIKQMLDPNGSAAIGYCTFKKGSKEEE